MGIPSSDKSSKLKSKFGTFLENIILNVTILSMDIDEEDTSNIIVEDFKFNLFE